MAYSRAYSSNYDLIDWSDFKPSQPVRVRQDRGNAPIFMADIAPFISPIDYSVISSRSQLREHQKRHQVVQVGTDLKMKDYANTRPVEPNMKALESAYRTTLEKKGLL